MSQPKTRTFPNRRAQARHWFELIAKILCISFNGALLFFGVASLIVSTWRLYTHDLVDGAIVLFINIVFAMFVVAISLYGCRVIGGSNVNRQIRYGFYAFVLFLINVGLLWHYVIYKKAFKNITENGANAYDDPADGKENSLLDSFRSSFYGYWNDGNCTGGECSSAGCVGSPIPFEPVVCESDGGFGRSVTDAGLKYDRTTDYLLECVDNQDRASDESVGMVTSLCYTREAWAADQKVDAMFGMIITAIFVAFLLFVLLSIVLFVSRPRTWQDDDVPLVKDSELELADLPPLEATPQEKQEQSSVHHLLVPPPPV